MTNKLQQEKLVWIDNLRAIATIGVIILHVSAPLIYKFGSVSMSWWWTANIFNSLVRGSVPLFLMVTGALLLPKEYELGDFLKKRFVRIVYPFAFWALMHIIMNLALRIQSGEVHNFKGALANIAVKISGGIAYHYWYVYLIIGIYLFLPIIGKWIRNSTEKEIQYFLLLWIITVLLEQTVFAGFRYFTQITYYFSGSLGFVVLGYYLTKYTFLPAITRNSTWLMVVLILSVVFTAFGTYYLSATSGKSVQTLYSYFTINVILATLTIFLLCMGLTVQIKLLSLISKYSYGIYLSHVLVLTFLSFLKIDCMFIHPAVGIILTAMLCISLSGLLVFTVSKLPLGKYISG
jgi:surface polysaccharide O-acyltransferase-like enzyme